MTCNKLSLIILDKFVRGNREEIADDCRLQGIPKSVIREIAKPALMESWKVEQALFTPSIKSPSNTALDSGHESARNRSDNCCSKAGF